MTNILSINTYVYNIISETYIGFKMQCPSCLLRFNTSLREPIIESCGHTLCKLCTPRFKVCPICQQPLSKLQQPKINYSLLQILEKDTRIIDKFIKVCLIGSSGVGKTSIIRMLTGKQFCQDIATTVGYDFMFVDRLVDGYNVRFQLWDSAGQERYRAVSPIHYKNAQIILIVYNVCCSASENQVNQWLKQADKHAPQTAKKLLIGNKLDLIQGKVFKPLDDETWQTIKKHKINRIQTSCLSHSGQDELWKMLDQCFTKRNQFSSYPPSFQQSKINPQKQRPNSLRRQMPVRTSLEYTAKKNINTRSYQSKCC